MGNIRLGVVGTGVIVKAMLRAVQRVDGIEAVAVCSRDEGRGRGMGLDRVYTDLDDMLKDEELDAIYIAVPNIMHFDMAKKVLLAGKHCLLEKPFCVREEQVRELVGIAQSKHLMIMETIPPAYGENIRYIEKVLPEIGRIRLVISNFSQYSSRYDLLKKGEKPYMFDVNYGGGALMDINYYNIFLNAFLFGRPEKVLYQANLWDGIDTSGVLTLRYRDFVSTNAGAKDTWGENFFLIEGENGNIRVIDGTDSIPEVELVTRERTERFNRQSEELRMDYEVEYFVCALREGIPADVYERLEITADAVWIAEQARKSGEVHFPGDEK